MQDGGGAEPQAADIRAPGRRSAILTSPERSPGLASQARGGTRGFGPASESQSGQGRRMRRPRGSRAGGGEGWNWGKGRLKETGEVEGVLGESQTCGLREDAECCTRVSPPRNGSPKDSVAACERKARVGSYVRRKTALRASRRGRLEGFV